MEGGLAWWCVTPGLGCGWAGYAGEVAAVMSLGWACHHGMSLFLYENDCLYWATFFCWLGPKNSLQKRYSFKINKEITDQNGKVELLFYLTMYKCMALHLFCYRRWWVIPAVLKKHHFIQWCECTGMFDEFLLKVLWQSANDIFYLLLSISVSFCDILQCTTMLHYFVAQILLLCSYKYLCMLYSLLYWTDIISLEVSGCPRVAHFFFN